MNDEDNQKKVAINDILRKTLGGLSVQYYLRQLFFGLLLCVFFCLVPKNQGIFLYVYIIFCMFLYPYSRFVYESIVGFIMGENVFFVNALLLLIVKFFTMWICYIFAPIISIFGFAYLYHYHSKNNTFENQIQNEEQ